MRISATPHMDRAAEPAVAHSGIEDTFALVIGTLLMALGIAMFEHACLIDGGTAGIAFLLHYASGIAFGHAFFLIYLPFYWLAWRQLGRAFTLKTFAAVLLLAAVSELAPAFVGVWRLQPLFAAVCGALLIGVGLLILFRHRASVGGVGIAAVALQERLGWRAGKVQMAADVAILSLARCAGLASGAAVGRRRTDAEPGARHQSPAGPPHRAVMAPSRCWNAANDEADQRRPSASAGSFRRTSGKPRAQATDTHETTAAIHMIAWKALSVSAFDAASR
jgi:hypothetical protein